MENTVQTKNKRSIFKRPHMEVIATLILLTAFLGQIYFQPFSEYFRFSLSVPALALILLYFSGSYPLVYSAIAGVTMMFFRGIIVLLSRGGATFSSLAQDQIPVLIFYLAFGLLFALLRIREKADNTILLYITLWVCEVMANVCELFTANIWRDIPLESAVLTIILIGGIRSGFTTAVYRLSIHFFMRYAREQQADRYNQMLLFFSSIKTDLLFFKKMMLDIEDAMQLSYGLYEKLEDEQLRKDSLSVTRRIHEVKKDYQRISSNIQKALSGEYEEMPMNLSEIFHILEKSTQKLVAAQNKTIDVSLTCKDDLVIENFYTIVSIISNLAMNAIEAMKITNASSQIKVTEKLTDGEYVFEVYDNGPGIEQEHLDYIFEPGYTTKFSPITGAMSSGVGLTHVKHVVEEFYGGLITVVSQNNATCFTIRLPAQNMEGRARNE